MKSIVLLCTCLVLVCSLYDFCESVLKDPKLYFIHNQRKSIDLGEYFKGFNLQYQLPSYNSLTFTGKAQVKEPLSPLDDVDLDFLSKFKEIPDLKLINVDLLYDAYGRRTNLQALIAHSNDTVVVARGTFSSGNILPKDFEYLKYNIGRTARCFNGIIVNENKDIVIDCQTQQDKNLMCLLTAKSEVKCFSQFQPFRLIKEKGYSNQKITKLLRVDQNLSYIISSQTALGVQKQYADDNQISIFKYQQTSKSINLVTVLNSLTFNETFLGVTDLIVDRQNQKIYISSIDVQNPGLSQLLSFNFYQESIQNLQKRVLAGEVRKLSISKYGTFDKNIYVANRVQIRQFNLQTFALGKTFQLDLIDNEVNNIQNNINYLLFSTRANMQYIYRKTADSNYKMIYLFNRNRLPTNNFVRLSEYLNLNYIYTIKDISMLDVNPGYLAISQISENGQAFLFARSGDAICTINIKYFFLENPTAVYSKTSEHLFSQLSGTTYNMKLEDYFGGSGLQYSYSIKQNPFSMFNLRSIKKIDFLEKVNHFDIHAVVGLNINKFYLIGAINSQFALEAFNCSVQSQKIVCNNMLSRNISSTIKSINGVRKSNGKASVAICYDQHAKLVQIMSLPDLTIDQYSYSDKLFAPQDAYTNGKYTLALFKKINSISVIYSMSGSDSFGDIDPYSFSASENQMIKGFYPKQIFFDSTNMDIFYVKTFTQILTFAIQQVKSIETLSFKLLNVYNPFDSWESDRLWTAAFGKKTFLVVQGNVISQFVYGQDQPLHTVNIKENLLMPLTYKYDQITQVFSVMTQKNNIYLIQLNNQASDCIKGVIKNYESSYWSFYWGWLLLPESSQAYLIPKFSQLSIKTGIPDQKIKQVINFTLSITGFDDRNAIDQSFSLEIMNFQKNIISIENDFALNLPESADQQLFQIPINQFFSGPIFKYELKCDEFCTDKNLSILTPLRKTKHYNDLVNIDDLVLGADTEKQQKILRSEEGPDNQPTIIVVLEQGTLKILDHNLTLKHSVIFSPPNFTKCSKIGVSEIVNNNFTIVVLCTSTTKQQILRFQYNQVTDPSLTKVYTILQQNFYINYPNSIYITKSFNKSSWIFIHDQDSLQKNSEGTVKIFLMTETANELQYTQVVKGRNFGLQQNTQQITGFHILDSNYAAFSIGKVGIGFSVITQPAPQIQNALQNHLLLNLKEVDALDEFTLNDTVYYGVEIIQYIEDKNILQLFVISSNAAHMVISATVSQQQIKFSSVDQLYNPLSGFKLLSWFGITQKFIMVNYYDSTSLFLITAIYKRQSLQNNKLINLITTSKIIAKEADLTKNFHILYKQRLYQAQPADSQKIVLFNCSYPFQIMANYSSPKSFDKMIITASNYISQANHTITVSFDGGSDSDIKWYIIVLIVGIVILGIGLGIGFYLKKKYAKEQEKNASLMSESVLQQQQEAAND